MSRQSNRAVISQQDLHWAAGIFEGEGTVAIAIRGCDQTYRLVCIVGNTDIEIIEFFQTHWAGWVQSAYGERPGRQPAWSWTVAGPAAELFLRCIRPAIRTRRVKNKVKLGLHFRSLQSRLTSVRNKTVDYKDKQRQAYLSMKNLNKRGTK